jgi:hypothetical protein
MSVSRRYRLFDFLSKAATAYRIVSVNRGWYLVGTLTMSTRPLYSQTRHAHNVIYIKLAALKLL